jgi:hypothetical protein
MELNGHFRAAQLNGDGSELGRYIFFSHSWPFMSPHGFIALKFMRNDVPK